MAVDTLRKDRAKVHDRMVELETMVDQSVEDRPGKLTDEQLEEEYATLEARLAQLDSQIEAEEKWERRRAVSTERDKRLSQSQGFPAPPHDAGEQTGSRNDDSITVRAPNAESDPNKGFKNPREFMTAVMRACMRSNGINHPESADERLKPLWMAAGSDEQSGASDRYGGYLVPVGFSPDVMQLRFEGDPIAGRTRPVPMEQPSIQINARVDKNHSSSVTGGLTVTRRPETVAGTSSRMEFEQLLFRAHTLFGVAYATEEILTDSPSTFAALIADGFQDEFAAALLNERINGTGKGEFEGALKTACLISIAKETGQAASTLLYENILKMMARCWRFQDAVWVANPTVIPQLGLLSFPGGTSSVPVFVMDAKEGFGGTLFGRPILFTEYCKALGTKGDIILGNWGEYLEGMYQPVQRAESMHVRFVNHERTFKFWLRNAGMPWWRSALTPKNGDTLSPFVTLDARA